MTIVGDLGPRVDVGGMAVAADGRIILYIRRDSAVNDLMLVENFR